MSINTDQIDSLNPNLNKKINPPQQSVSRGRVWSIVMGGLSLLSTAGGIALALLFPHRLYWTTSIVPSSGAAFASCAFWRRGNLIKDTHKTTGEKANKQKEKLSRGQVEEKITRHSKQDPKQQIKELSVEQLEQEILSIIPQIEKAKLQSAIAGVILLSKQKEPSISHLRTNLRMIDEIWKKDKSLFSQALNEISQDWGLPNLMDNVCALLKCYNEEEPALKRHSLQIVSQLQQEGSDRESKQSTEMTLTVDDIQDSLQQMLDAEEIKGQGVTSEEVVLYIKNFTSRRLGKGLGGQFAPCSTTITHMLTDRKNKEQEYSDCLRKISEESVDKKEEDLSTFSQEKGDLQTNLLLEMCNIVTEKQYKIMEKASQGGSK